MASQDFVIIEHSGAGRSLLAYQKLTKLDANPQNSQELAQTITAWLAPTEYSSEGSEFRKHVGAHVLGTGNWIFSTHQFEKWSQSEDVGTLWIKGIPGSGKSVVAANLIKTFLEKGNHPVLYFFFRHTVDSNSKPIFLVRDFLAQLLPHSAQLASQLNRLMGNFPDIDTAPIKDLWDALLTSLATSPRVFIIVDALDEVELGQEAFFTDSLLRMNSMRPQAIKLVITSRPLPIFENSSETAHTAILRLSGRHVDLDIFAYISHRLESQKERNLNQEEISSIKERSCGKEHGLFLQARLMLDEVLRSNEPIQSLLGRSMRSMSEMYQGLLREHSIRAAVSEELQLHVLRWIVHASRPLRLLELAALPSSQGLFVDIPSAKRVLRICCGPLLEVLENETIQVIHHSFTEFLLDDARIIEGSQGGFPVLNSTLAHKRLALECLDYMLKSFAAHEFHVRWRGDQEKKDFLLKYPFMQYSAQHWHSHVLKSNINDDQVFEKVDKLLTSGSQDFNIWLHLSPDSYKALLLGSKAIHASSFLGLKAYAEHLLQRGINPNSKGPGGCTPIMFAAMRGYADIIDLLVVHGGDPDAKDSLGLTAMHMAAVFNHSGVIHALARCGSELLPCKTDTDGGCGTPGWTSYNPIPTPRQRKTCSIWNSKKDTVIEITPIRFACEFGCSDSVVALIQCMDSVQRATIRLQWAAYIGHAEILSILLKYPEVARNIDQVDDNGDTPLIIASREKWPGAVRVLLEAGANISARSENVSKLEQGIGYAPFDGKRRRIQNTCGKTALEAWTESCSSGVQDSDGLLENMDTVGTLLIQAGCDVDVRSSSGSTPLFSWSTQSQTQPGAMERFVSILLKHGADPRATAEDGHTPLHMMRGHKREHEAILLLINAGADINAVRRCDGKTPLLAMITSSAYTIEELNLQHWIDYGVDFNKCDNEGNTVLHYLMSHSRSNEVVNPWIDVCNPRAVNILGETCLFSITQQWPVLSSLSRFIAKAVKVGLDLEARNNFGRTALMEACFRGGNGHVLPFIDNNADAAAIDSDGKTCKSSAIQYSKTNTYSVADIPV
jgi:ankyrin repeat protein